MKTKYSKNDSLVCIFIVLKCLLYIKIRSLIMNICKSTFPSSLLFQASEKLAKLLKISTRDIIQNKQQRLLIHHTSTTNPLTLLPVKTPYTKTHHYVLPSSLSPITTRPRTTSSSYPLHLISLRIAPPTSSQRLPFPPRIRQNSSPPSSPSSILADSPGLGVFQERRHGRFGGELARAAARLAPVQAQRRRRDQQPPPRGQHDAAQRKYTHTCAHGRRARSRRSRRRARCSFCRRQPGSYLKRAKICAVYRRPADSWLM